MSASHRGPGPLPPPGSWSSTGSGLPPGDGGTPPPPAQMPPAPPPPPEVEGRDGPAWERRTGLFDLGALVTTILRVLFDAGTTFRTMVRSGGVAAPMLFLLVSSVIFVTIGNFWQWLQNYVSGDSSMDMIESLGGTLPPEMMDMFSAAMEAQQSTSLVMFVVGVLFGVALNFVLLLVWSGIVHLLLMIVNGAKQSFETTLRVVAYCMGSTAAFLVIPICGGVIGFVWLVVIQIIGLAPAHETTPVKTAFAVLFPTVLCCGTCCAAFVFVVLMISGAGV